MVKVLLPEEGGRQGGECRLAAAEPAPPGEMGQKTQRGQKLRARSSVRAFLGKARSREMKQDSGQGRRMWRVMVIALLNCFDSNDQSFLILTKT